VDIREAALEATAVEVVPRASAVVPRAADAEAIVIHEDHINMVKFSSKEDNGYKTVSGHLQIMAQSKRGYQCMMGNGDEGQCGWAVLMYEVT
jgi:hypothetical protein